MIRITSLISVFFCLSIAFAFAGGASYTQDALAGTIENKTVIAGDNTPAYGADAGTTYGVAQDRKTVSGTITDADGEPLPGVNVVERGTTNGTATDADGKFTLSVGANAVLQISYIGFYTQNVTVGNQAVLQIKLAEDSQKLDEIVVTGYGSTSRRNLTTSVSTVDADKMKNLPVSSVTDALAGRASGLIVTRSGGGINKRSAISIRGGGTPIVVIDGFVMPYQDFENLNPDDIESMSLLKDASSAAVYGSRAGDGVIVIKTKSGAKGLRVDYSFNHNWSEPTYLTKKLGSYEVAEHSNFVRSLYGIDPQWTAEEVEKYRTGSDPYNYPNVDWQKTVLRDFAPEQKHSLAVRGGSEFNKYYVSLQTYDQQSLYKENSNWLKRYNFTMNETSEFKDLGLTLNFGLNAYIYDIRSPLSQYSNGYWQTWGHIQNQGPMSLAYNPAGQIYVGYDNPLAEISMESGYSKSSYKMIVGQSGAEWKVYGVEGLKVRAGGNYRIGVGNNKSWQKTAPQYDLEGNAGPDFPVSLTYDNYDYKEYTLQAFADYKRSFLDETHNVSATFGFEANYSFYQYFMARRKEYIFMIDQMGAGPSGTMENGGREAEAGRAGFVGQLDYNYKKKYYINGSLRHDGSDLFPKDRRWGTFFAGTAAYAVSEEPFFQPLKDRNILNFLKFRAGYGQIGLDSGVGRFSYLSSYSLNERGNVVNGNIVPTFSEGALVSDAITWYTRNTFNVAFDFSTLNERLGGTFEYFYMKTKGYLTSPSNVNYTDPLGLSLPQIKSDGEHRRDGYELSLSWKDKAGDLSYEVGGNLTYFDQLVAVAWNEDLTAQKNPYRRAVQQRGYWGLGLQNLGYYANSDDVLNSPHRDGSTNLTAGDIKYKDTNGDGRIDDSDQNRIGKNGFPRGNYGIFANLNYKGVFANILFQGATSRDMYLDNVVREGMVYPYQQDYWMPDNRGALYPRPLVNVNDNGQNNYQTSDFWLVDGRYIRLKTLQLGYDLRAKLLRNVKWIYKMEVVLSGQNLFTLSPATKYGFDPENGSTNNYDYPMERTWSVSVNVGF
ncbi:MAG: TonB-dependent receptor [Tannerella sp.]|nr:TonB-dependent receptor [Tannerella sp.]